MEPVETFRHCGIQVSIYQDESPPNPRKDWDNLGTMVCWHPRYDLGDATRRSLIDCTPEAYIDGIPPHIKLPVALLDHSGLRMYVGSGAHTCDPGGWDSGQVGWIYVTLAKVRAEFGWKHITKARRQQIEKYLEGEVETYDQYLSGDVYGYVLYPEYGEKDSCWGYFGIESCCEDAKSTAEYIARQSPYALCRQASPYTTPTRLG